MKLKQLQEAKYAEPETLRLTGDFYTGNEGEYVEQDVTITIKRGRTTRHGYDRGDPRIVTIHGAVQSVQGGKIAREVVTPNTTVRFNREQEGWSLSGFTTPGYKQKYGDTWILFDPNYNTNYDLQEARYSGEHPLITQIKDALNIEEKTTIKVTISLSDARDIITKEYGRPKEFPAHEDMLAGFVWVLEDRLTVALTDRKDHAVVHIYNYRRRVHN